MTLLVPYDGSALSRAALERATQFSRFVDEPVVAIAVIPDSPEYAVNRGWIGSVDAFDTETIAAQFESDVASIAPGASFRAEVPDASDELASAATDVVRTIRRAAAELEASIIFVGSENAGRVAAPLSSVGKPVAEDPRYDVHIVRHAE